MLRAQRLPEPAAERARAVLRDLAPVRLRGRRGDERGGAGGGHDARAVGVETGHGARVSDGCSVRPRSHIAQAEPSPGRHSSEHATGPRPPRRGSSVGVADPADPPVRASPPLHPQSLRTLPRLLLLRVLAAPRGEVGRGVVRGGAHLFESMFVAVRCEERRQVPEFRYLLYSAVRRLLHRGEVS